MEISHVGVVTQEGRSQALVNKSHTNDICEALEGIYSVHYYDIGSAEERDQLFSDHKAGKLDIVFNNCAGKNGGDGTVEGMLDIAGIPYVGSDTLATAVAFDKKTTKAVVENAGVPTVKGLTVSQEEYHEDQEETLQRIEEALGYPIVVKASRGSDSIGISVVRDRVACTDAMNAAFKEDDVVIVEQFIERVLELGCMVIGTGLAAEALDPLEPVYHTEVLYKAEGYRVPECDAKILKQVQHYARIAHQALGCLDYSRSDLLIDKDGNIHFLEINAHAGLGKKGPTALAAKLSKGWDYPTLIQQLINLAAARYDKVR